VGSAAPGSVERGLFVADSRDTTLYLPCYCDVALLISSMAGGSVLVSVQRSSNKKIVRSIASLYYGESTVRRTYRK